MASLSLAALLWQSKFRLFGPTINQCALQLFSAQLAGAVSVNGIKPVAKAGLRCHWGRYTGTYEKPRNDVVSQVCRMWVKTTSTDEGDEELFFCLFVIPQSSSMAVYMLPRVNAMARKERMKEGTIVVPDHARFVPAQSILSHPLNIRARSI